MLVDGCMGRVIEGYVSGTTNKQQLVNYLNHCDRAEKKQIVEEWVECVRKSKSEPVRVDIGDICLECFKVLLYTEGVTGYAMQTCVSLIQSSVISVGITPLPLLRHLLSLPFLIHIKKEPYT